MKLMGKLVSRILGFFAWLNLLRIIFLQRGIHTYGRESLRYMLELYLAVNASNKESQTQATYTIQRLNQLLNSSYLNATLERFGPAQDAGYYLPIGIPIKTVITGGVGKNFDFEKAMASKQVNVFMYDGSIESIMNLPDNINFNSKFIKPKSSFSTKSVDISTICKVNSIHHGDILLKLDIEGDEYDVLVELLDNLNDFSVIIIEFHSLYKIVYEEFNRRFNQILGSFEKSFDVVFFNSNNNRNHVQFGKSFIPEIIEVVFVNSKHRSKWFVLSKECCFSSNVQRG